MKIGSKQWKKLIADGAQRMGIEVDPEKIEQFTIHALELVKWTQKINLTSITEPKEIATKHFLDSIVPASYIPPHARLLDVGSGGGFPGIPLKVLIPSLSVKLIDAVRKKVSFLNHVIRLLHLTNIEADHTRADNMDQAHQFDVIISRALFSLEELVLRALPLLAKQGLIIAFKGRVSEAWTEYEHLCAIKDQRISIDVKNILEVDFKDYTLPEMKTERTLIIIKIR